MPVMRSVFSSTVDTIGYDAETQQLHVQWNGGKTSVYSGVPPEVADDTMNNWSVGKAVNAIKDAYPHKYADD